MANKNQYYGLQIVETTFGEYAIAESEDEANSAARQYIKESVWAFNSDFLASHCNISAENLAKVQQELCEDANEVLREIISDFDHFVKDAITADGRGHFLSINDGEESTLADLDKEEAQEIRDELKDLEINIDNLLIYRL